jgi:hypothetical protein
MPLPHYPGTHCKICGKSTTYKFDLSEALCDKHYELKTKRIKLHKQLLKIKKIK